MVPSQTSRFRPRSSARSYPRGHRVDDRAQLGGREVEEAVLGRALHPGRVDPHVEGVGVEQEGQELVPVLGHDAVVQLEAAAVAPGGGQEAVTVGQEPPGVGPDADALDGGRSTPSMESETPIFRPWR